MSSQPNWGVVATVKADTREILNFAAHHLDLGAHRVYVYFDADTPEAFDALKSHPKCRPTLCDAAYWKKHAARPAKHQARQTLNATHAYNRRQDVDWLAHVDVDEFLLPASPIAAQLAALPSDALSARVPVIEALSSEGVADAVPGQTWFKSLHRDRAIRATQTTAIYPTFGEHMNGGFLSHVAGKIFARTGLDGATFKIHRLFIDGAPTPRVHDLPETELAHLHAATWDAFQRAYRFRLDKGSYRAELKPGATRHGHGLNMHDLLTMIEAEQGETGLRAFYDEVCTATPELRAALQAHGLLRSHCLDLDTKRLRHFGKSV